MTRFDSETSIPHAFESNQGYDTMDSEKPTPFPWIVQFVAAAMIVFGVMGLCCMLYRITFVSTFTLDLSSAIYLLLGHFLLRRSKAAYNVANFFIFFSQFVVVICIVVSIAVMCNAGSIWVPQDSSVHSNDLSNYVGSWWAIVLLVMSIPLFLFFWYLIRVWQRPETVAVFNTDPKPKGTGNWSSILIIIGLILGVIYSVMDYRCRLAVNQVYCYDASIYAVDRITKSPISDGLSISTSALNPSDPEKNFGLQSQASTSWGKDNWHIQGKSIEPVEAELNADGYEPATVTIGPGTQTYTVEMRRKK